jgi:hypothetical protein
VVDQSGYGWNWNKLDEQRIMGLELVRRFIEYSDIIIVIIF